MKEGFVYILTNRKGGVLYIGVTDDLARRLAQHRTGTVRGFAKKYNCDRLVWFERHENIHDARIAERRMKAWKREWKIRRIEESNPGWDDLSSALV
ncbi:MAG: GIY-YIG nuclease family protein [Erythrobacter sp.]|uniref:GIY-YIG nuclease family protein n=1 Tax=Erythrobacter sp. HL-111 TaxID=1798193 RepID=UPI0006DA61CF|nr:GIY-YIG nuclease family protein [Erythrobacter sp. HL-111]KPP94959.1 MAG: putative endonuclease [Erythrobacteraceae bacterium HL-111]SDS14890.1 putative endonuclease [Erythrobacter sp. HL-111]